MELYFHVLCSKDLPVTLLNGACYWQLVLDSNKTKAKMSCEVIIPAALGKSVYIHTMALMSKENGKKLNNIQNAVNSTVSGMMLQLVKKACHVLKDFCSFGPLQTVIALYMRCNSTVIQLNVLSQQSDGFGLLKPKNPFWSHYGAAGIRRSVHDGQRPVTWYQRRNLVSVLFFIGGRERSGFPKLALQDPWRMTTAEQVFVVKTTSKSDVFTPLAFLTKAVNIIWPWNAQL